MHDVVGHVVLATRDEDLGAVDFVFSIANWFSTGGDLSRDEEVRGSWGTSLTWFRSDPHCGSVKHMVPVHSPEIIRDKYFSLS
jgi:hypothetical protein